MPTDEPQTILKRDALEKMGVSVQLLDKRFALYRSARVELQYLLGRLFVSDDLEKVLA